MPINKNVYVAPKYKSGTKDGKDGDKADKASNAIKKYVNGCTESLNSL